MQISRCVCCQVSFSELLAIAKSQGLQTLDELQEVREFGTACGLCKPYVREALSTGKTTFSSIIVEDA